MEPKMNKYQRACQLWPLLAWAASNSQILIYEKIAGLVGISNPRNVNVPLGCISEYCKKKRYPLLNSIVVNKNTGEPGSGVIETKRSNFVKDQVKVRLYGQKWLKTVAPKPSDFEKLGC